MAPTGWGISDASPEAVRQYLDTHVYYYKRPHYMANLRKRNENLWTKLKESLMRKKEMKEELKRALEKVKEAEEAEEILCSQLGDLEAETLNQARDYQARISSLMEQLSTAKRLLQTHSLPIDSS